MTLSDEITSLEASLKASGRSIADVLAEAGVNRSTWTRWKNGDVRGARYDTFQRVKTAAAKRTRQRN